MPTQPKLPISARMRIGSLRLRCGITVISEVLSSEVADRERHRHHQQQHDFAEHAQRAQALQSSVQRVAGDAHRDGRQRRAHQAAGPALELRIEPTSASPAAASTAAAGPCINSSRKMKISPAANEFFEPGMRTG